MRIPVPLHELLFPDAAKVWPCLVIHSPSIFAFSKSLFNLVRLFDEIVDPVIAFQRACFLLVHPDCEGVVVFVVESLRVVWVVVLCVGSSVVGSRCWLWFFGKLGP